MGLVSGHHKEKTKQLTTHCYEPQAVADSIVGSIVLHMYAGSSWKMNLCMSVCVCVYVQDGYCLPTYLPDEVGL